MDSGPVIERLRTAARALGSGDEREVLKAVQAAQDALDAVKADALVALNGSKTFELDGASTVTTWTRNELRLDARQTHQLLRAGAAMRELDAVGEAAHAGRIRLDHVDAFAYGIKHIDAGTVREAQPWLLDVALTCEPSALRRIMRELREAVYPGSLDDEWARGMNREDLQVNAVPDGWHVNGFLNTATGAKLKTVLDTLSAPSDAEDKRTGAERRVTAVDDLCSQVLEHGLPSDGGIRPHLSVLVDADGTATLERFGRIGPQLLDFLGCDATATGIVVRDGQALAVGRTKRLATKAQRLAVNARQGGICAAPGCTHTHLQYHHIVSWSAGGPTDLDNLIGLCVRCHQLLHRGHLQIIQTRDGTQRFAGHSPRPERDAYRQRLATYREKRAVHRTSCTIEHHRDRPVAPLRT